nr:hypothetical protein [Tanacetum cinerariifolium]
MEKLESENVPLEFQVQSLIKERENVKSEYQKLFDSIKKTRTQTQGEINELIEHVNQKTYAYAEVRAQKQDLLVTIFELKAKLKKVEKGPSAASSVRRPLNRDSPLKNNVLSSTKKSLEKVDASVRTNKKTYVASKNAVLNKKIATDVDVQNTLIAKDEVVFWVKMGFSAHISAGFGSVVSIRRIQLIDMAYLEFIITQPQRQADVHQDELCPPNKRYALMDANKKIDLEHPLCPNERKILANILQNHLLRFIIVASSSVPWIYLGQFWHTLKKDGSKYKLSFVLDKKELTMTLDDFKTIFHLPQATDNNHDYFFPEPKFSEMVSFYINNLGFTLELRSPSNFNSNSLIMQMLSCFVNNIHVNNAELLWEGFHYSIEHPTTLIPYPRFTKLIKTRDELEAKQNVQKVEEHFVEEIEKLVERTENVENVEVDISTLRKNDNQNDPDTRLEPRSNKESLEVEITAVVRPVNVNEDEEESAEDDYELKRMENGKHVEDSRNTASPTTIRFPRIQSTIISLNNEKLQELMKFERLYVSNIPCRPSAIRLRDQNDHHDDAHPDGKNSAKRQIKRLSMKPICLENRHLVKSMKVNQVHQHQNPHAKIFYIKKQKEPGKSKEVVYSNSKIVHIIKTYWELGHEHKFITKIVARRANGSIVSITKSVYMNLNKNDIEDLYLLIVNGKLGVESYQQKVNLTAPTITFPSIEKFKVFSIVSELVYGIIYKNNKKKKSDETSRDAEYLQLFEEKIEEWLKHRDQMRRWEMYVHERPLGSRRERPE